MKHAASFSTGLSSAVMVERLLQKYDAKDVIVLFMDTTIEDEDNYRFKDEMEARWQEVYGIGEIVTLCEGRSPYEVADDQNIIPNQRVAPCTLRLKVEPFRAALLDIATGVPVGTNKATFGRVNAAFEKAERELRRDHQITVHVGFDFTEVHRCGSVRRNYEAIGYEVDFPLLWKPYETRPYTDISRYDWGIEPPRTYAMGFTHANCLGKDEQGRGGCVKFGQGDRIRQLIHFPDAFMATEEWESEKRKDPKWADYALLRNQSNGTVSAKPLEELRLEYEKEQTANLSLFDYHDGCIQCGIGDLIGTC